MVWRIKKVKKNEKMEWNGMRKMGIPNKGLSHIYLYIYSSQNIYMRSGYRLVGVTGLVHMHTVQCSKIPHHFVWSLPLSTTSRNIVSC